MGGRKPYVALRARPWLLAAALLGCTLWVTAQSDLPPRWDALPKLAAKWPASWAALVQDARSSGEFEKVVVERIGAIMTGELTADDFHRADIVLSAALRHSQSARRTAPLADDPSLALQTQLADRLANVRKDWLVHLQKNGSDADALKLADTWLPTTTRNGPLRTAILSLWSKQARSALEQKDYVTARAWLIRAEAHFEQAAPFDEIAKALQGRAETLFKESQAMPDAQAVRSLEESLLLWPRLPEARDALERRRGTHRTLIVAVRALPEQLSPATAASEIERQSLDLVFDRLLRLEHDPNVGKRYRPQLAVALPADAKGATLDLRKDVYWSSGERLTAADVRHTALLMNQADAPGRSALWRDFLEAPRVEGGAFHLNIGYRQGLFDPAAPLTFWILPQYYRGKQLQRGDDPDFAKAPIGSGPYYFAGRKVEEGKVHVAFRANPHDLRAPIGLREIRMMPWTDAKKDFPKPPPHLVFEAPHDQRATLKGMGYTEVAAKTSAPVQFLAVNHRRPSLAPVAVRRAIAHALDRQTLLDRHFRANPGKEHATATGLFARDSWASAPAPRVPAELFQMEQARSFARQAPKDMQPVTWTLKYSADDPRVKSSCEEMASAISAVFKDAQVKIGVQVVGLAPKDLRRAIHERDFDLLYTAAENLDDPLRLAMFFDRQEDATRAGGSNLLGYENDVKLSELVRGVLQHRQFSTLQDAMHALHVHLYEAMPVIPLWQLDAHVMVHPSLRTPPLDPHAVFRDVRQWKIEP